jgi:hypothetical protein
VPYLISLNCQIVQIYFIYLYDAKYPFFYILNMHIEKCATRGKGLDILKNPCREGGENYVVRAEGKRSGDG